MILSHLKVVSHVGPRFQVPGGWIFVEAKGERGALDGLTLTANRGGRKDAEGCDTQTERERGDLW